MSEKTEMWAIVEVMGHQRYVGVVSEHVFAGTGFVRVDVPANGDVVAFTKLIGTGSIYCITPVSEDIGRKLSANAAHRPVSEYEIRTPAGRLIEQAATDVDDDDDGDMFR